MSNSRGGWELSKENIQPLSCGRRMADLADALPTQNATQLSEQQQYEAHHLREIEKLEKVAKEKKGEDPLQAWVNLIKYYQQHFPNMSTNVKNKYGMQLRLTLKEFYADDKYSNDDRYVKIIIASLKCLPPVNQIACLSDFLSDGKGETVCEMYIRLAELFDGKGDTKNASDILKKGIEKNAQPKDKLEEMLTYIQEVWAKNYANCLKNVSSTCPEQDSQSNVRNFASSVPISGENNEAVSIRRNLQPAAPAVSKIAPVNSRQNTLPQKLSVFNEENVPPQINNPGERPGPERLDVLESIETDRENRLDACRWNSKHTQLENPVIPEPPEKLKLYQDESDELPSIDKSKITNKRALREKKEESELSNAEVVPTSLSLKENTALVQPTIKESQSETEVRDFTLRRNYHTNTGKDNFFENIKYKPLPPGRLVGRIILKCNVYFEEREKEMKTKENMKLLEEKEKEMKAKENMKLLEEIERLRNENKNLQHQMEHERMEQKRSFELKLFERDQKVCILESQNEDLMNQLTRMTTNNNVRESQFERLRHENQQLKQEIEGLQKTFEEEKQLLVQEIQHYKQRIEALTQGSMIKRIKQETLNEGEPEQDTSNVGKKKSFVDIHVCSRTMEAYSSPSTDQGTDEISRFHSGETTIEHHQSVAASSFMPDLNMGEDKSMFTNSATVPTLPRKALGMVERPLEKDMMNLTPATAPPLDFEDIPPPSFECNLFKPSRRGFEIFTSFCNNSTMTKPASNNSNVAGFGNKRVDIVKCLQNLPENMPPPPASSQAGIGTAAATLRSDENLQFTIPSAIPTQEHFRRPAPPSDENAIPATLPKPRRSIILARPQTGDSSDEEEEIILRRHQQTGVDLNVSNLTTLLALGPKPLINSTPERERTLRNLPSIAPRALVQHDEEPPVPESHAVPTSRFSILNEPPLNLSTIQETSRENRSRSTTGSSSGNTMSSTRFGTVSGSTQLYGNMTSRSSSVPRSASRVSQQNNNGYYSDTNAIQ